MSEFNKQPLVESFLSIDHYASTRFEIPPQKIRASMLSMPDTKERVRSIDIYDICVRNFEPVIRQGKKSIVIFILF